MTVDFRRAVLRHLGSGADSRFGRSYLVSTIRQDAQCADTDVWEALWGLVGGGLVYLDTAGQGSGTDNWRWRLSADGERVARGGTWEPRDPDGYLDRIRREIPDLDDLVEPYLTEALQSFNGRRYLATSVMLGVAAERAFLVMAGIYAASSMAGAPAMTKELAKPRSNYFTLWTEFRKRIEPVRPELAGRPLRLALRWYVAAPVGEIGADAGGVPSRRSSRGLATRAITRCGSSNSQAGLSILPGHCAPRHDSIDWKPVNQLISGAE